VELVEERKRQWEAWTGDWESLLEAVQDADAEFQRQGWEGTPYVQAWFQGASPQYFDFATFTEIARSRRPLERVGVGIIGDHGVRIYADQDGLTLSTCAPSADTAGELFDRMLPRVESTAALRPAVVTPTGIATPVRRANTGWLSWIESHGVLIGGGIALLGVVVAVLVR
jgi:hypothetical protein